MTITQGISPSVNDNARAGAFAIQQHYGSFDSYKLQFCPAIGSQRRYSVRVWEATIVLLLLLLLFVGMSFGLVSRRYIPGHRRRRRRKRRYRFYAIPVGAPIVHPHTFIHHQRRRWTRTFFRTPLIIRSFIETFSVRSSNRTIGRRRPAEKSDRVIATCVITLG